MKAEINSLKNRKVSLIIQCNLVSLKQKQIRQCLKCQLKKRERNYASWIEDLYEMG